MIWGDKRYHSLDYELKQTFGEKVYRLSLNGGMTCPNRDGTLDDRGCIFCSAGGSGDFAAAPDLSVHAQILSAKKRIQAKTGCKKFIAYFQAYTNTSLRKPLKNRMWQHCPLRPAVTVFHRMS